jgi:hypothetical protein
MTRIDANQGFTQFWIEEIEISYQDVGLVVSELSELSELSVSQQFFSKTALILLEFLEDFPSLPAESPVEVTELTKKFLTAVLESEHVMLSYRLQATKLMRKVEAPKVTQQTVRTAEPDRWRET